MQAYRKVPLTFHEFVERRVEKVSADDRQSCDTCAEHLGFGYLDGEPNPSCLACIRYHFGYEQAEEALVRSIIGGAVAAALATNVPEELVRLAFEDALRGAVRFDGPVAQ